ncbi:MAG: family 1 encapsulin nanocompartment shell protein [Arcobacteraceae bacterium]
MEILNKTQAPFGQDVWTTIESELGNYLAKRLNLRSVVDFNDSYGFSTDAINTGNLKKVSSKHGTTVSTREPIKMVEIKHSFSVSKELIEDLKRGKVDFDNSTFTATANNFAKIENDMILNGLKDANIGGMISKETQTLSATSPKDIMVSVAKAMGMFNSSFVDGPFTLVISSTTMAKLMTESFDGKSLKSRIDDILGKGSIIINNDIGDDKALVISQRGGDFEYYSGLDVCVGYEGETKDNVELFLLQTCSFRTITPEALIVINIK